METKTVVHITSSLGGGALEGLTNFNLSFEEYENVYLAVYSSKYSIRRIIARVLAKRFYRVGQSYVSLSLWTNRRLIKQVNSLKPDIVVVHWIGDGALGRKDLSRIHCHDIRALLHDTYVTTYPYHIPGGKYQIDNYFGFNRFYLLSPLCSHYLPPNTYGCLLPPLFENISASLPLSSSIEEKYILLGAYDLFNDQNKGFYGIYNDLLKAIDNFDIQVMTYGDISDKIDKRIIQKGRVTKEQADQLIANAWIVCVPSQFETFSFVAYKAFLLKKILLIGRNIGAGYLMENYNRVYYLDEHKITTVINENL